MFNLFCSEIFSKTQKEAKSDNPFPLISIERGKIYIQNSKNEFVEDLTNKNMRVGKEAVKLNMEPANHADIN